MVGKVDECNDRCKVGGWVDVCVGVSVLFGVVWAVGWAVRAPVFPSLRCTVGWVGQKWRSKLNRHRTYFRESSTVPPNTSTLIQPLPPPCSMPAPAAQSPSLGRPRRRGWSLWSQPLYPLPRGPAFHLWPSCRGFEFAAYAGGVYQGRACSQAEATHALTVVVRGIWGIHRSFECRALHLE